MAVAPLNVPDVSVVVPVYNGANTLAACLESLLAQDYPRDRYEVLIVDNNSTDGTAALIQRYQVRYVLEQEIQSSYAARNRGVREARAPIIAFTDADCVPSSEWLRRGLAAFSSPEIGGVAGAIRPLDPRTLAQRYAVAKSALSQEDALAHDSFRPAVYTANAFYRTAALVQAGWFDPAVKSGGDVDLAWRVQGRLRLRIVFCPEAVVFHEHRRSVRDLLRQRRLYGYGSVVNYVKYRSEMGQRTLRQGYWELSAFTRRTFRLVIALGRWAASFGRSAEWRETLAMDWLDVLVFVAKKTGQLEAAVKHRVWYF